jgi:hypothetical protein
VGCSRLTLAVKTNENAMGASPTARVNVVSRYIQILYEIHVRCSPGLHRTCTGAALALHRADRRMQSRIANVVSRAISESCLRNRV